MGLTLGLTRWVGAASDVPASLPAYETLPSQVPVEVKRRTTDSSWRVYTASTVASVSGWLTRTNPPLSPWGGRMDRRIAEPGMFRVQRVGGRWVGIDPDGYEWFSVGICSVSANSTPRGMEALRTRWGTGEEWARATAELLKRNGFNTLACWSDWFTFRRAGVSMPYMTQLNLLASYGRERRGAWRTAGHMAFSNDCPPVFDQEFATYARQRARQLLADVAQDPACVGHFSDNELPFRFDALDRFLALPERDEGHQVASRWHREFVQTHPQATRDEERSAFLEYLAQTYFRVCATAIREADPNHLYLGSRFYGGDLKRPQLFRAAGRYVDVISVNWYGSWTPDPEQMAEWERASGRPVIITEWYAKGMDSGLPNITGAGWTVRTQRDRGLFYQNFTLALLRSPACVGWHWFKYMDNDPTDTKADPSNLDSNKGVVRWNYEPYAELLDLMQLVNHRVYPLRDFLVISSAAAR